MSKVKNIDDYLYGDRHSARKIKAGNHTVYDASGGHSGYGKRCYHSHPPLKLPGSDLVIYGGSCLNPAVTDADIYIGFDSGMRFTPRQFPWTEGHELLFKIQDMGTPNNVDQFRQLLDWTYQQLQEGKKVHCGCIGGHGRTGTFLAALVSLCGEKDAVSYVRENYCHKAVESRPQIEFLSKHFGIKPAKGSKSTGGSAYGSKVSTALKERTFPPIRNNGCIWDEL